MSVTDDFVYKDGFYYSRDGGGPYSISEVDDSLVRLGAGATRLLGSETPASAGYRHFYGFYYGPSGGGPYIYDAASNAMVLWGGYSGYLPPTEEWLTRMAAAGENLPGATKTIIDDLFGDLTATTWFDKIARLNIPVGGSLAGSLVPQIDSEIGVDLATNMVEGDWSESLGWRFSGTSYIDTGFVPDLGTGSISVYLRTGQASAAQSRFPAGGRASGQETAIRFNRNGSGTTTSGTHSGSWGRSFNSAGNVEWVGTANPGWWTLSRPGETEQFLARNGAVLATTATPPVVDFSYPFRAIWIGGLNDVNGFNLPVEADTRIAGYAITLGMTPTEEAEFYSIIQTCQTALGRNV